MRMEVYTNDEQGKMPDARSTILPSAIGIGCLSSPILPSASSRLPSVICHLPSNGMGRLLRGRRSGCHPTTRSSHLPFAIGHPRNVPNAGSVCFAEVSACKCAKRPMNSQKSSLIKANPVEKKRKAKSWKAETCGLGQSLVRHRSSAC